MSPSDNELSVGRATVPALGLINTAQDSDHGLLVTANEDRLPKLNLGSTIPGTRFKIVRWLGQGGMGVVFEVRHLDIERRYAAKLLSVVKNPARTRRFREEARTISQIGSPWIVEVFDFKELDDGRLMYLMELVPGPSLHAILRDEGPIALPRLLGLARQVCKGLHDAHAVGFVHRDVKPENIMLGTDPEGREQVKLVDFGLAALLQGPKVANNSGTPAYMSPEQCRGQDADERTDIYSLGATLYELSCGRLPFEGPDEFAVRTGHLEQQPRPPSRLVAGGLPPGLDEIILRCMAKQPSERYASAAELEAALIELQLDLRMRTPSDHLPAPQLEDTRRQRRLDEGLLYLRSTEQLAERRRMIVGIVLLLIVAIASAIGWSIEAKERADAISLGQLEIDALGKRAREAAARASWVYPPIDRPESETALQVVLELEALDIPGAAAAAHTLREEFADTLVSLGDSYWDRDGGREFAREFYVQALLFDRANDQANERAEITPLTLLELAELAARGAFSAGQLASVEPLVSLAETDPEQRIVELTAVRDSDRISERNADNIDRLLTGFGAPPAEPIEPPPVPLPDVIETDTGGDDETGGEAETEGETGDEAETEGELEPEPTEQARPDGPSNSSAVRSNLAAAKAAYESGNDRAAERSFHQVLDDDKRNVDALVGLHRIHFDRGEWRQALDFARRAATLRPKRADLQLYVGDSCMKVLDYDCARDRYEAARRLGHSAASQRLRLLEDRLGGKK